jgi:hypothetical protein
MAEPDTYHDRDGWIWFDGKLVEWRDAEVHVLTHALHYASSVFEGQRAYNGDIFKLAEHSERLHKSANILGFEIPWSVEEINAACREVLTANELEDAYMRPVAWLGSERMGVSPTGTKPHLAIAAWKWGKYFDPEMAKKGIRLTIAPWRRPAPYTAPVHSKASGLYMIAMLSRKHAEETGYDDALMLGRRQVVRHRFLVPAFAGSNPAAPARATPSATHSGSLSSPARSLDALQAFAHLPVARQQRCRSRSGTSSAGAVSERGGDPACAAHQSRPSQSGYSGGTQMGRREPARPHSPARCASTPTRARG